MKLFLATNPKELGCLPVSLGFLSGLIRDNLELLWLILPLLFTYMLSLRGEEHLEGYFNLFTFLIEDRLLTPNGELDPSNC
jgi:hypothetical protein